MADPGTADNPVIAALEAQRAVLGDAAVDAAIAALRARAGPALPRRRLLTVLMLDIVGSTGLVSQLDPEDASVLLDGALAAFAATIQSHGGRVLQFTGDGLLAAFGADAARETDAEQAVRAGLALLARARELPTPPPQQPGLPGLAIRVGVHSGPVLLGGGVDAEGSVRGLTVHVAARMEQSAAPGSLQVSQDTWRLIEGLFVGRALPAVAHKPGEPALRSWVVEGPRGDAPLRPLRGVAGVGTPLLGRDAELACFDGALERLHQAGTGSALCVLADAGLGKSRLGQALWQRSTGPRPLARLRAAAHPDAQHQAYGWLRQLLVEACGIASGEPVALMRARFMATLAPAFAPDDSEPLHRLGHLVGLDFGDSPHLAHLEARQLRDRALAAFERWLRWLAGRHGGLLLLADDLHWADDASLDLIQHLAGAGLPMLLLALARPSLLERRPDWRLSDAQPTCLAPLDLDQGRSLAQALLVRLPEPPAPLVDWLVDGAGGNPFYMEELLKALVDDGVIADGAEDGRWRFDASRLGRLRLPITLGGLLQVRLDALPAPERRALGLASILGSPFWDEALAAQGGQAQDALPALQAKGLLVRDEAQGETPAWSFSHHLLQQAAYDSLLKAERVAGHAAAAAWLSQHGRGSALALPIARHHLAAEQPEAALPWLAEAAEHALARFDNRSAIALALQGLALGAAQQPGPRWRLALAMQRGADQVGDRDRQAQAVAAMEAVAASAPAAPGWPARAAHARGVLHFRLGEHEDARRHAERAVGLALAAADAVCAADAYTLAMNMARLRGDLAASRRLGLDGLAQAQRAGNPLALIRLQGNLGLCEHALGHFEAAYESLRQSAELAQQHQHREIEAVLACNLGGILLDLGDHAAARHWAERGAEAGRATGDSQHGMLSQLNLALALRRQGRLHEALAMAQPCLPVFVESGARLFESTWWVVVSDLQLALGDATAAIASAERAGSLFEALGVPAETLDARAHLAQARLAAGQAGTALADLQPVLAHLARQQGLGDRLSTSPQVLWVSHQVLAANGDTGAAAMLQRAHQAVLLQAERLKTPHFRRCFLEQHPVSCAVLAAAGAAA